MLTAAHWKRIQGRATEPDASVAHKDAPPVFHTKLGTNLVRPGVVVRVAPRDMTPMEVMEWLRR